MNDSKNESYFEENTFNSTQNSTNNSNEITEQAKINLEPSIKKRKIIFCRKESIFKKFPQGIRKCVLQHKNFKINFKNKRRCKNKYQKAHQNQKRMLKQKNTELFLQDQTCKNLVLHCEEKIQLNQQISLNFEDLDNRKLDLKTECFNTSNEIILKKISESYDISEWKKIFNKHYKCNPNYCEDLIISGFTPLKRAYVIDFLMEVAEDFSYNRNTFFYAVNYFDRFLSNIMNLNQMNIQLVGITSLYIAAKIEEQKPRQIRDYAETT